jgi:hypothetical protein
MFKNRLFYLSNSDYGGWVSFTYHLANLLQEDSVIKIKPTLKGGGTFYGNVRYFNVPKEVIKKFEQPIITAVDKAHYQYLRLFKNPIIVIHDPTELSEEMLQIAKTNKVITIRESVHNLLLSLGINNQFLKHPFYKYKKEKGNNAINRSLSRVDFDKNTHIICKANNLGAGIEIYGYKNHIYYFHKLKELGFDSQYKGYYSKKINDISSLYANTKYLVDLSTIKQDGGGTQYTFLEAEYHHCGLILHKDWCNVPNSVYRNGENCHTIADEHELLEAINKPILKSNLVPTEEENNKWIKLCK